MNGGRAIKEGDFVVLDGVPYIYIEPRSKDRLDLLSPEEVVKRYQEIIQEWIDKLNKATEERFVFTETHKSNDRLSARIDELDKALTQASDELCLQIKKKAKLTEYVTHKGTCYIDPEGPACTCGLAELLATEDDSGSSS